jgi:hypothetical protein
MSANASSKSADAGQVEPEESHSLAAIPNVQSSNLMCNDDNDMMSPDEDDIDARGFYGCSITLIQFRSTLHALK